jgi:glycosyltransferase involved in cell wall biosynthesis
MTGPVWSVVIPLFNELEVVDELVTRCLNALDALPDSAELVLVDDASHDGTGQHLAAWQQRDARVRPVLLAVNGGQFRATQAGLEAARGRLIVTLDGDLQDPPELIPLLAARLQAEQQVDVVFAAKDSRQDPAWIRAGALLHEKLQRLLCGRPWPGAVGSFAAMRASTTRHVRSAEVQHANLSAVLVGAGARFAVVRYHRALRQNGDSRVGALGLVAEAIGSLVATGAMRRGAAGLAALAFLVAYTQVHLILLHAVSTSALLLGALVWLRQSAPGASASR